MEEEDNRILCMHRRICLSYYSGLEMHFIGASLEVYQM